MGEATAQGQEKMKETPPSGLERNLKKLLGKRVPRRSLLGGAAAAGAAAAGAYAISRLGLSEESGSTESGSNISWEVPELKDDITSFSQFRQIIETFPKVKNPDSEEARLRAETLALVEKNVIYERIVNDFVDVYHSYREADGTPTLLKLYKQRFFKLNLGVLIEKDTRYKNVDEFLEDDFFFMAHNRYFGLDRGNASHLLRDLKKQEVGGPEALRRIHDHLDEYSIALRNIENDGYYLFGDESLGGNVRFVTDSLNGNTSKMGRTIEQDKQAVLRGLGFLPAIGNVRVELVESIIVNKGGEVIDAGGRAYFDPKTREAVVMVVRNKDDLRKTAIHERAHNLDVGNFFSVISRFRLAGKMIPLMIDREELLQSSFLHLALGRQGAETIIVGVESSVPYPGWHEYWAFLENYQDKLAKYSQEEFKKKVREVYNEMSSDGRSYHNYDERIAWRLTSTITGDQKGIDPWEILRSRKYLDTLKKFAV